MYSLEWEALKALSIPQTELRQESRKTNQNITPFICPHNPNNFQIFQTVRSTFEYLKSHKVPSFTEDLNIIQSKRQAPNLKENLQTEAEFTSKKPCVSKCGDSRYECCQHLRLSDHYSFKNVNKTFTLKTSFSCDSSNLMYVIICSGCQEEYIGETGLGKSKLRDRVGGLGSK